MDNNCNANQNTSDDELYNHKASVMECRIEWNSLSLGAWNKLFYKLPYSTISQSYEYARAYCALNHLRARWGVILIDGEQAGLVQLFEVSILGKLLYTVIVDRGPLWFEGYNTIEVFSAFLQVFHKEFPKRIGRKVRFIPEVPKDDRYQALISEYYKNNLGAGYQTILLDISQGEEKIRENLQSKWRNQLRKAEKADLEFHIDDSGSTLSKFLANYRIDREIKSYTNLYPKHLPTYFKCFMRNKAGFLAHIGPLDDPYASALIFMHGNTAIWQIGWLSDKGRNLCANHLLIYKIIMYLHDNNIANFDLGGVNDAEAAGVKHFKAGTGGQLLSVAGMYT